MEHISCLSITTKENWLQARSDHPVPNLSRATTTYKQPNQEHCQPTDRGGGADSVTIMPGCACRKVKEMGHFFASSVEVNEKISFKMGKKFATSVCIGKDFLHVWHIFVCKSTGGILQSVSR